MIFRRIRSTVVLVRLASSSLQTPSFSRFVEARPSPGPLQVVGCLNSIHRFERRWFTTFNSEADYETVSNETLESLCEHFEELLESDARLAEADVTLASGVLNVTFPHHGTFVINKQTPNQQIWLSSPFSGPARFDFDSEKGWVYKRTGETLHQLLNREIGQKILELTNPGFENCFMGSGLKN